MTIDPRREATAEPASGAVRPDVEAAMGALAAVASGAGFRTRIKVKTKTAPAAEPDLTAEPAAVAPQGDDLELIRGITPDQARRLAAEGITTFAAIAAWRRDDVLRARRLLGLKREISRQNWIEQAALLAERRSERTPARLPWPTVSSTASVAPQSPPARDAEPPATASRPEPPASPQSELPARSPLDRLDLIRGMCPAAEALLRAGGIVTASDIAGWTSADVACWRMRLGAGKRLAVEGWIEQAAMLARGEATAHARAVPVMPDIESIPLPGASGVGEDGHAPLLARLRTARLVEAGASPAHHVPVFEAPPTTAAAVADAQDESDEPKAAAPAVPRRPLPRFTEQVRPPLFELPPLPLAPRFPEPPTPPTPVDPPSPAVLDPGVVAAATGAAPDAPAPRRHVIPASLPHRARRPRPSNLVPRRPRSEPPREVLQPVKRLTERIAELDPPHEPPQPAEAPALASLVRRRPSFATETTEAEVVIVAEPASNPVADPPAPPQRARNTLFGSRAAPVRPAAVDADAYLAYRDVVEEASVEIVIGAPSGSRADARSPTSGGGSEHPDARPIRRR